VLVLPQSMHSSMGRPPSSEENLGRRDAPRAAGVFQHKIAVASTSRKVPVISRRQVRAVMTSPSRAARASQAVRIGANP
jgi:hypothetical protein